MTEKSTSRKNTQLLIAPSDLVLRVAEKTNYSTHLVKAVILGQRNNLTVTKAVQEVRESLNMPDPRELIPAA